LWTGGCVGHQLVAEIDAARRVDLALTFIRLTGILPLLPALQDHTHKGGLIRVLTTACPAPLNARPLEPSSRTRIVLFRRSNEDERAFGGLASVT
jgi:hypothetical protein